MIQENPEHSDLTKLGEGGTHPNRNLETFPNRNPERDYVVELRTSEFTCICPKTGQPDFAEILIRYVPDPKDCRIQIPETLPLDIPGRRHFS